MQTLNALHAAILSIERDRVAAEGRLLALTFEQFLALPEIAWDSPVAAQEGQGDAFTATVDSDATSPQKSLPAPPGSPGGVSWMSVLAGFRKGE